MDEHVLTPDLPGFRYTNFSKVLQVFGRGLPFCDPRIDHERDLTVWLDEDHLDKLFGIDLAGNLLIQVSLRGGEKYAQIRLRLLYPYPEKPVKLSVSVRIETGALYYPVCQNTAELHLVKCTLKALKSR